jgi:hypothetical protein
VGTDNTQDDEVKQSLLRLVDILRLLPSQLAASLGIQASQGGKARDASGRFAGSGGGNVEQQGIDKILAGSNRVPFVAEFRQGLKEGKAISDGFKELFSGNKALKVLQLLDKLGTMFSGQQKQVSIRQIPTPQAFGGMPANVRGLLAPPPQRQLPPPITVPGTVRSVTPPPPGPGSPPPRTPPPQPPGPATPPVRPVLPQPPGRPPGAASPQAPQSPPVNWRPVVTPNPPPPARQLPIQPQPSVTKAGAFLRGAQAATVPQGGNNMGGMSGVLDALKNIASILKGGDSQERPSAPSSSGPQISGSVGGRPMGAGGAAQGARGVMGDVGRMAKLLSTASSVSASDALQIIRLVGPLMAVPP